MIKDFKRHYHKVKSNLPESLSSLDIQFQNGELFATNKIVEEEKTTRFIILMRRFLNPLDKLFYKKVWHFLKINYEFETSFSDNIDNIIEELKKVDISIKINDNILSAEKVYEIISEGEYFNNDEKTKEYLANLKTFPIAGELLWNQFYSYTKKSFYVMSKIFDVILEIEKNADKENSTGKTYEKQCIYCLGTESQFITFNSEEHIFPESLGNYELLLEKGIVCDKCNNGRLAQLDQYLLAFEAIAYLQILFVPYTKNGTLPKANFQNMTMEKTSPLNIVIKTKDKTGEIQNKQDIGNGLTSFNINIKGKKFDPKRLAKSLYKIALGILAYDKGVEEVCNEKYNKAREFVQNEKTSFNNNLLMKMDVQLRNSVEINHYACEVGTPVVIDIYGLRFVLNLEEKPIFEIDNDLVNMNFSAFQLY